MKVGLGTGSTVAHLLTALAERGLSLRCVSSSPARRTWRARSGSRSTTLEEVGRLDIAIDGADEVADDGWLIKGGGGAHTREKIVAAASDRFVAMVDSTKPVPRLTWPVPVELLEFGIRSTLRLLGDVEIRDVPRSPDGGVLAIWRGRIGDPAQTAAFLSSAPAWSTTACSRRRSSATC